MSYSQFKFFGFLCVSYLVIKIDKLTKYTLHNDSFDEVTPAVYTEKKFPGRYINLAEDFIANYRYYLGVCFMERNIN